MNLGYIDWPHKRLDTDDDRYGMWVFGFWLAHFTEPPDVGIEVVAESPATVELLRDPFLHCDGAQHVLALPRPHTALRAGRVYPSSREAEPAGPLDVDALRRGTYLRSTMDAGAPILAAVLLGTTPCTYVNPNGTFWAANEADLTRPGRKLVGALSDLYGNNRPVELVTYVDVEN